MNMIIGVACGVVVGKTISYFSGLPDSLSIQITYEQGTAVMLGCALLGGIVVGYGSPVLQLIR